VIEGTIAISGYRVLAGNILALSRCRDAEGFLF
jgi:hypothetical protein